jgi:RNA polymerase sigma-70 factor (ECF subfamily)
MTPDPADPRRSEFDALYQRFGREVWALAYARWPDAELALDVAQEAFLRLWRQWEAGDTIDNPRAWLMRVARNLAEDFAKSSFRKNGTQPPQVLNGVKSDAKSPQELLEDRELFDRIRVQMAELAPADRDILTLKYALDYDAPAIAEVLDVNVSAVHMRLSRARQRLADRLTLAGVTVPS